jgi:hypothetical protein
MMGALWAQDEVRGHWSGVIDAPNQQLTIEVDLDRSGKDWIGSISIPQQNASGIPLEAISFSDGKWKFGIKGIPGNPTFVGALSDDKQILSGDYSQGAGSVPFRLKRNGEPKVEVPKSSPPLAKEFLGTWEGTLEAQQSLRLRLKMFNEATGAKAVL